jgi:hypothetical protein
LGRDAALHSRLRRVARRPYVGWGSGPGVSSGQAVPTMPIPNRPRQSGLNVFWALLTAIERTTQLEAQALEARDFRSLDVLHEAKRADFDRLVALGKRIGIDRSHPVLAGRLQALEMAERRNEEAARQGADQIRAEMEGLSTGQRRLRSLKYAYADEEDHRPPIAEG